MAKYSKDWKKINFFWLKFMPNMRTKIANDIHFTIFIHMLNFHPFKAILLKIWVKLLYSLFLRRHLLTKKKNHRKGWHGMIFGIVLPLYQDTFGHARKMLYYPNVLFLVHDILTSNVVLWRFFLEIGLFQSKMSFCIHKEDTWAWKNTCIREICSQHSLRFPMLPPKFPNAYNVS